MRRVRLAMPRRENLARVAPRTLWGRLALTYFLLVLLIWAIFGAYLIPATRSLYLDRLSSQLETQGHMIGEAIRPALATGQPVDPLVKRLGAAVDERITIIAVNGQVLGDSQADPQTMANYADRPEVRAALASGNSSAQRLSATLSENFLYVATLANGSPPVIVRVALPLDQVEVAVQRVQREVIIAALAAGLLMVGAALLIGRRIAIPLDDLRRQASAVATGRLDVRVTPATTRELGELGRSFNAMAQRLQELRDQLTQAHDRLEMTLANLSDGVLITASDGSILRLNPAARRLLGVREDDAIGRSLIVVSRDHDLSNLLRVALAMGEPQSAMIEHGSERRLLETTARPLRSGHERLGLVMMRDVTELRRLERMRREFVANVSHELRTPLASVRLLVETLAAGAIADPSASAKLCAQTIDEIDQLTGLVNELLDLARLESGGLALRLEPSNARALAARAVERLQPHAERAGVALRLEATSNLPAVRLDRVRVEQLLINLIHNAIKFTPAGGSVVVSVDESDGALHLAVRDTGIGIPPDDLPRIFERFYKTDRARRSPGSGLGLAIVKHIALAHGGAVWVESAVDQGTTIHVSVPAAPLSLNGAAVTHMN